MTDPAVTAIVLSYNGWPLLRDCLPLVLAQTGCRLDVWVVDNGSRDGTTANLARDFPQVHVLTLPENLGFTGGNNAGVAKARTDYVALISNDVRLPPDFIRRLTDALAADPQAAVAGPVVDNLNLDMSLYPRMGTVSLTGTLIYNVFADPRLAFDAAGCSLVYRRDLLGLPFDADYHLFHEDIYLAWRARLLGYTVIRVPEVVVRHIGSATVGALTDANRYYIERNRSLNFLTFFSAWTRLRVWPLWLLAHGVEWGKDLLKGRSRLPVRQAKRWLREHRREVLDKRRRLQALRRVPDREIIRWMSGRVLNPGPGVAGVINAVASTWCRLTGLRTWELGRRTR